MERKGYPDGIVRYPVSVAKQPESSQADGLKDLEKLNEWKEQQTSSVPDGVIKGIKEIEEFLANTSDAETLQQMLSSLTQSIQRALSANKSEIIGVIESFNVDEDSGDITIEYDNGETKEYNNEEQE